MTALSNDLKEALARGVLPEVVLAGWLADEMIASGDVALLDQVDESIRREVLGMARTYGKTGSLELICSKGGFDNTPLGKALYELLTTSGYLEKAS